MPEYPEVTRTDHFESHVSDTDDHTFLEEERRMATLDADKPIDLMMKEAAELHEFAEKVAQGAMERIVQIIGARGELSLPVETRNQWDATDPSLIKAMSNPSLITELRETYLKGIRNSLTKIQMAINSL